MVFQLITENAVSFYLFVEQVNPKIKKLFTKLSKCILQFVCLNDIHLFSFQLPAHYGLVWREQEATGTFVLSFYCPYEALSV